MTEAKKEKVTPIKAVDRQLSVKAERFDLADQFRTCYTIVAEVGTTRKDVLKPCFLAHCAHKLSMYDQVEIRIDDDSWIMFGFIRECGRNWALIEELNYIELDKDLAKIPEDSLYEVAFKGSFLKHCVIRKSDGEIIAEKISKKSEAIEWMKDYERNTEA